MVERSLEPETPAQETLLVELDGDADMPDAVATNFTRIGVPQSESPSSPVPAASAPAATVSPLTRNPTDSAEWILDTGANASITSNPSWFPRAPSPLVPPLKITGIQGEGPSLFATHRGLVEAFNTDQRIMITFPALLTSGPVPNIFAPTPMLRKGWQLLMPSVDVIRLRKQIGRNLFRD